jgi:UDP-N-acetylglucosamine--N-acetylmuramyl-(pentapeptide) pyrophosphoryl-undecaprenol N-acetylglucosamine transferase
MPGSGAAHSINLALSRALPLLKKACPKVALLWMCGPRDLAYCQGALKASGLAGRATAFIERVDLAYGASDALLTRAGSSMLAELAAAGLPGLLVPYPYAARDHQRHNAEAFVRAGAASMLLDAELSGQALARRLVPLLKGGPAVQRMRRAAKRLSRPDAARNLMRALQSAMGAKRV